MGKAVSGPAGAGTVDSASARDFGGVRPGLADAARGLAALADQTEQIPI